MIRAEESQNEFQKRIWTIPNALSVFRVLTVPLFAYYSIRYTESPENRTLLLIVLGVTFIGFFSDFLDGFIARRFHQQSALGQYLDPVSDKIVTISALVILVLYYRFPVWMLAIYILRELFGTMGGAYLYLAHGVLGKPNWWGKWGIALVSLIVVWYIVQPTLALHLDTGHILRKPILAVYVLLVVLIMGMLVYMRTYWHYFFTEKKSQ